MQKTTHPQSTIPSGEEATNNHPMLRLFDELVSSNRAETSSRMIPFETQEEVVILALVLTAKKSQSY